MKKILFPIVALVLTLAIGLALPMASPVFAATEYDIRGQGSVTINGTIFQEYTLEGSTGTGVFKPFLQVNNIGGYPSSPVYGFSTDLPLSGADATPFCIKNKQHNVIGPGVFYTTEPTYQPTLDELPKAAINNTLYVEFMLDSNQAKNDASRVLTWDQLRVYQTNATAVTYAELGTSAAPLVWDLDSGDDRSIVFDAQFGSGSGEGDMRILVPFSLFNQSYKYVIVWVSFGGDPASDPCTNGTPSAHRNNDGFEEFGYIAHRCCMHVVEGSIDPCYPDVASAEAAARAATNVTDICNAVAPTVNVTTVGTCSAVITVTATDACGNEVNVTYHTRIDSTSPVLANLPSGGDLGCNPTAPVCATNVTATDNCDGAVNVTCTPGNIAENGCFRSQTFTYSAVDSCGNEVSQNVTYTWKVDTTPPEITCPPDFFATGGDCSLDPEVTGWPTATDNCGGLVVITYVDVFAYRNGTTCPWKLIRTWTATDECGNNATCTQEIVCCCEDTVWAYSGSEGDGGATIEGTVYQNDDLVKGKDAEWGWTNQINGAGNYTWDVWAGAGRNILANGNKVGTVTVIYDGSCVNVTYTMDDANKLSEAHLWVGNTTLPLLGQGKKALPTASPGLFPYRPVIASDGSSATWSGCGFTGTIYVAAHGVTMWCEPESPPS